MAEQRDVTRALHNVQNARSLLYDMSELLADTEVILTNIDARSTSRDPSIVAHAVNNATGLILYYTIGLR